MERAATGIETAAPLPTPVSSERVSLDEKDKSVEAVEEVEEVEKVPGDIHASRSEPGIPDDEANVHEPGTDDTEHQLDHWNQPRINTYRFLVTLLGFIIVGMNDACFGALIPYLEIYYNINHSIVSAIFIVPLAGYIPAALLNNKIHHGFGQRGVAILGPVTRLVGYVSAALHPPFPALPVLLVFSAFGNGIEDAAWNAWIGNMQHSNELLGILHGMYGFGATIGPLLATALVTQAGRPWFSFFYIMVGMTALELVVATLAFWPVTGAIYRKTHNVTTGQKRTTTRKVLRGSIPWLLALFLLGTVGVEVCVSGWSTTYMLKNRDAEPFIAGFTVTMFFIGLTIGRFVAAFLTGKIGEKLAVLVYTSLAVAFGLLYWFVSNIAASVVFTTFLGVFVGPLFPCAIVAVMKLLPVDHHISAIGFAASFAAGGSAIVPLLVGAIAQSRGVWVMHPAVLATLLFMLLVWTALPGGLRPGGLERARVSQEPVGKRMRSVYHWVGRKCRTWSA